MSDEEQFKKSEDERFAALDLNSDGVLSRSELPKAFESMRLTGPHFGVEVATTLQELTRLNDSILDCVDCNGSGDVNLKEFRSEMREIMLAIRDSLESCPIQMAVEEDEPSFLKPPKAADIEPVSPGGFNPVPAGTGHGPHP